MDENEVEMVEFIEEEEQLPVDSSDVKPSPTKGRDDELDGDFSRLVEPLPSYKVQKTDVTKASFDQHVKKLTYVEYPGHVVNFNNAIITMGGISKISNTFASKSSKLEIKFRPSDPYCNSAYAEGSSTCGFLVNVRRRKKKRQKDGSEVDENEKQFLQSTEINTTQIAPLPLPPASTTPNISKLLENFPDIYNPLSADNNDVNADPPTNVDESGENFEDLRNKLEARDRYYSEQYQRLNELENNDSIYPGIKRYIYLPTRDRTMQKIKENEEAKKSDFQISVVGVVERSYLFRKGQVCDFQYLPTRLSKGKQVSILNKILPMFGDPEKDVQFLSDNIETVSTKTPLFLVPPLFSKLDKPVGMTSMLMDEAQRLLMRSASEGGIDFEKMADLEGFAQDEAFARPDEFVMVPFRAKRVTFSHVVNFRATDADILVNPDANYVPTDIMNGAIDDLKKHFLENSTAIPVIKSLFEQRPIWSKQALEVQTKKSQTTLKYILPTVAYFAVNGPWRSLWIKLGYDPRKFKEAFEYQTLDYRIPFVYRNFVESVASTDEANCIYRRDMVPPKCQMFYQLCDVHIKEVDEIRNIMRVRLGLEGNSTSAGISSNKDIFSPKFGFMDEMSMEYCRYSISRYVEQNLKEQGRITALTLPEIELLPGGVVPKDKLKPGYSRNQTLPSRRKRSRPFHPKGKDTFAPRGRARRNSESSSINDLEIDRDELGASIEDDEDIEDAEFDENYGDDSENDMDDMDDQDWPIPDPDSEGDSDHLEETSVAT